MNSNSSLKIRIKREAEKLGFSKVGIASMGPTPHFESFQQWLSESRQGGMAYLARQAPKRRDPRTLLPSAKSLLVLGMNYFTRQELLPSPLKGRISRYALGNDYHEVIRDRLEQLLSRIRKEEPAVEGLCYVDTGPIMEKAWGSSTSLGWIGKHTNLVLKGLGSWFFLGVILLNIPLEPDAEAKDYCGTCRRCMDACPAGAIIAPHVLDARICISYLTIEYRGHIPRHLRSLMGDRIFGCDSCQEACPWNRFSQETVEKSLIPVDKGMMVDLVPLVDITQREFKNRFGNSPICRATRDGFVRNVVTALGNSRSPEAIPALQRALRDTSVLVRAAAAWALGRVSGETTRAILTQATKQEHDPVVLEEINRILR